MSCRTPRQPVPVPVPDPSPPSLTLLLLRRVPLRAGDRADHSNIPGGVYGIYDGSLSPPNSNGEYVRLGVHVRPACLLRSDLACVIGADAPGPPVGCARRPTTNAADGRETSLRRGPSRAEYYCRRVHTRRDEASLLLSLSVKLNQCHLGDRKKREEGRAVVRRTARQTGSARRIR